MGARGSSPDSYVQCSLLPVRPASLVSKELHGHIKGLAPSDRRQIERLYTRRLERSELISLELARELWQLASRLRRRLGLLISREGHIEEVVIGTRDILYLPDLGRYRLGSGRLRRLRLVFSDLGAQEEPVLPSDIITDLEKLRLDAVVAVKGSENKLQLRWAHLSPAATRNGVAHHSEHVSDLGRFKLDFTALMQGLEQEIRSADQARHKTAGPGAVLVGVYSKSRKDAEASLDELRELARTARVEVLDTIVQRREPDPRTLLGKGKLEEVVLRCLGLGADLIVFDTELRPSQWRAVTNATELKVIDRSMLILDIFAQRAKSSEGRIQVELAQLKYNLPRLVEKDAGLSRLSGGIGGRGPGETKLEIGRRRARDRIAELERRISKLGLERQMRRQPRREAKVPLVAIVGYTNAGKSTLFNVLTKSHVVAEDKLFATLDPTHRRLVLPPTSDGATPSSVVLSDTVGFIRDLPEELVAAFRATLEELRDADLLLHVIDGSDEQYDAHARAVTQVLTDMQLHEVPRVVVVTKIDCIPEQTRQRLGQEYDAMLVSAQERLGLEALVMKIAQTLRSQGRNPQSLHRQPGMELTP